MASEYQYFNGALNLQAAHPWVMSDSSGDWLRLYLFDVPATSGMQWLAIGIVAPEAEFERAAAAAVRLVDSIEVRP